MILHSRLCIFAREKAGNVPCDDFTMALRRLVIRLHANHSKRLRSNTQLSMTSLKEEAGNLSGGAVCVELCI